MNVIKEKLRNFDIVEQYISIKEIITTFLENYKQNNPWRLRLIDSFIVFNAILFILQFVYVLINGLFPMNSLIAGLVCCLGSITLAGKN
jgi:hypothetical protein